MKMFISFSVDVDWCDEDLGVPGPMDPLRDRLKCSVESAIADALSRQRDNGFNHDMEDLVSILADSEITAKLEDEL